MIRLGGMSLALVACGGPDTPSDAGFKTRPDVEDTDTETTPEPGVCPTIVEVSSAAGELLLDGVVTVELDTDGDVWVICTLDSDPDEQHLVESTSASTQHELHVLGLAENSHYNCEVRPACDGASSETFEIETQGIDEHDGWTVTREPVGEMSGVYTLFNDAPGCVDNPENRLFIIDPDGRVRWTYDIGNGYIIDLDHAYIGDGVMHIGGGWGLFEENAAHRGIMRQIDMTGNVLLERTEPDFGLGFNHHSEVLDDGQIVSLTTSRDTDGNEEWYGVAVEQWDPATAAVTWSWTSQQLFDDGTFGVPNTHTPYHANSLTYRDDVHGSAVWISLYHGQMLWRVDRPTGDLTHQFGPGGDFTLYDTDGAALPVNQWHYVAHDPDYVDNRILLYDNGVDRPGGSYSRVVEYEVDLNANTAVLLWSWTEPGWYSPVIGDADYQDNGNVLVTRGQVWCIALNDNTSALIELDGQTHEPVWRLDYNTRLNGIFRSERYDGCELFANAKYCPDVAERIATLR